MNHKRMLIAASIPILLALFVLTTAARSGAAGFAEDFESAEAGALPSGWATEMVSGTKGVWATGDTTVHPAGQPPHSGSNLVYFNAWSAGSGEAARLYRTTPLDLGAVDDAWLSFWMYHDNVITATDRLHVQLSTDDGATWQDVGAPVLRYNAVVTGWISHTVSFQPYMGAVYTDVLVGFLGISDDGNDLHLDDVAFKSVTCDFDLCDKTGEVNITGGEVSPVGEFSLSTGTVSTDTMALEPAIQAPSMLAQRDYYNVYNEADALLTLGTDFREATLTISPTAETITDALKNYATFTGASETFYKFCSDYDQIDHQGYCLDDDDIRNRLIRARELFGFLSLAEPADATIPVDTDGDGENDNVRALGREGVLAATREIANVHMIFGNEFMVDALDYRFSSEASSSADKILENEIGQLEQALQQFTLAVDVLAHAFNADFGGPHGVHIGDYFTEQEFELFGIVSERMVQAMDEIANRYRQMGQDEQALAVYSQGSTAQYMQALALANKALERDADFLQHGGWEMMNNLGRLRAMTQAIHDGLNPFGFMDEYVPVHTYRDLFEVTQQQFYRDAKEDEGDAEDSQRRFDHNENALNKELQNLRLTYNTQLLELCGASENDYQTCEGGLMEQNYYAMEAAATRIRLADQRLQHIPEKIQIEQDRAGEVINLTMQGGQALSALSYAIGVRNAYRETTSIVDSTTDEWHTGVEYNRTVSAQATVGFPPSFGVSVKDSVSFSAGYKHSRSRTHSISKVWDPAQKEIGRLNGLRDVQQAATQAQITGANSNATIRNLLLEQADLMIELDLAINEWNRLSAAHNHLVEKYENLLNLRAQAQDDLLSSYLNNPAYRILRETETIEASRSHGKAAQFAYLTAKALEYEYLTPVPFIRDIYKARTADDIDNFLIDLEQWNLAMGSPGYLNRYPYEISIAQDLLGLSDENLDPEGELTPTERAQLRYALFQEFIQSNTNVSGTVEFQFTTSLLNDSIFSSNIWNNRIAGVGLPASVPGTQGIAVNMITRQFGDVGTPEVVLSHEGQASYRKSDGSIIEYTPGRTKLVGYTVPPSFQEKGTTAVILCSVNGNEQGTPNSALFNLSVAASSWTLRIDPDTYYNRNLDVTEIEDIVIEMDSTGIALTGSYAAAQMDSLKLRSEFDDVPLRTLIREEGPR